MSANSESAKPAAVFEKCSVVLVDVLGTTTSINFAKETLFPFVTKNAQEILKTQWESEEVKEALKAIKKDDSELDVEGATKLVSELTEAASEAPGLKTIQGLIYQKGYESGDLKSHVFEDVPAAFDTWSKTKKVCVYSTGSANSQKQLFKNSIKGDLTGHISNYFDQSVGAKTETDSYKKIVKELAVKPEEVLFISDQVAEVKAALEAGLSSVVVSREGNAEIDEADVKELTVIKSFAEISFENPQKRKIEDEPAVTEEPPTKMAKTTSEAQEPEKNTVEPEQAMEVDSAKEAKPETPKKPDEAEPKKPEEMEVELKVDSTSSTEPKEEEPKKTEPAETSEAKPTSEEKEEEKPVKAENSKAEAPKEAEEKVTSTEVDSAAPAVESVEKKVEEAKEKKVEIKEKVEAKEVNEAKEGVVETKVEASSGEESKAEEKTVEKKEVEEEKENKKDLANGLENGEKEGAACALNGEASVEKPLVNGDSTSAEEPAAEKPTNGTPAEDKPKAADPVPETAEEIKAKKAEAAETPAKVTVEA